MVETGLAVHSVHLESIICHLVEDKFQRVFPCSHGHDTYSFFAEKNTVIIISVLRDFHEITPGQKESYRSFLRNAVNAERWKMLIIGRKEIKSHLELVRELVPVPIKDIKVEFTSGSDNRAEQIADHVHNFIYGKPIEGYSTMRSRIDYRCKSVMCPQCGEKSYLPTDILIYNQKNAVSGLLFPKDWTENICANMRLHIPQFNIKNKRFSPLIFQNLHPSFLCPVCAETLKISEEIQQPELSIGYITCFNYDDLCKIQHIHPESNTPR